MNEYATRDPDLTRARILDASLALFLDQGFAAVTMREIAERSGVTKSLIHHHFGTKEALWEAVKEYAFLHYYEAQKEELTTAREPNVELLRSGVVRFFEFLRSNPQAVRLFALTHLEGDTSCSHLDEELAALGAERVRQAQQRGLLRDDINPMHVVAMFINVCTQWFEAHDHHARWPGIGSDDDFLEDFLKVFMDGLQPHHSTTSQ
ncbi:MAG: TetR/AcrR family transcriptional regulator [Pseudomonadota bacterium]|nr:MAG: TetR/AcrR family transcriptional regulator [Pseudomonadota bacterium]